jgi:hypothetical protein
MNLALNLFILEFQNGLRVCCRWVVAAVWQRRTLKIITDPRQRPSKQMHY